MSKQIFFICVVVIFTFLNCSTKKTTAEGDPLSLPSETITDNIMSHLSVVADTIYEPGIENPILINIKLGNYIPVDTLIKNIVRCFYYKYTEIKRNLQENLQVSIFCTTFVVAQGLTTVRCISHTHNMGLIHQ